MDGVRVWKINGKKNWQKKPKYSEKKFCPYATLSTSDAGGTGQEPKPTRRGDRPATNHLSIVYGVQ
jgi:hypothetical protein